MRSHENNFFDFIGYLRLSHADFTKKNGSFKVLVEIAGPTVDESLGDRVVEPICFPTETNKKVNFSN